MGCILAYTSSRLMKLHVLYSNPSREFLFFKVGENLTLTFNSLIQTCYPYNPERASVYL